MGRQGGRAIKMERGEAHGSGPRWIGEVAEPFGLETVLALGWGQRGCAGGESETVENFPSRVGRVNSGENA